MVRSDLDKDVQFANKMITKIEDISREYHEAGQHLKNIGRTVIGKETVQDLDTQIKTAQQSVSVPEHPRPILQDR